MKDEIRKLFPLEFYINDKGEMVSEISLITLNKLSDEIIKLEDECNFYKCTDSMNMESNIELRDRIDKAIEMFEKAFDYRDSISVNNWEYDGGEEEYIEMLESAYNILKGSDK